MKAEITFLIPTIGRDTLVNSLESLVMQSNGLWKAVVVYDGIEVEEVVKDDRILYVRTDVKMGSRNVNGNAGLVRNFGFGFVDTEWVAFLDDDDILTSLYVEDFYKYNKSNDIVVFRMMDRGMIIPNQSNVLSMNNIGISFAFRKVLLDNGVLFKNSDTEDYFFIQDLLKYTKKYVITDNYYYIVKPFR